MARDIAIVGMGCELPGAASVSEYWTQCLEQRIALSDATGGWRWERYLSADGAPDTTHTLRIGRVGSTRDSAAGPALPQAWLARAAREALRTCRDRIRPERSSVVLGAVGVGFPKALGFGRYQEQLLTAVRQLACPPTQEAALAEHLRQYVQTAEAKGAGLDDALASILAEKLATDFGFGGPRLAVDSGFASALAALDVATRQLNSGTVDFALCGAVSEPITPRELVWFANLGALARRQFAPFDTDTDGTLLGEGAILFALKRWRDAVRDGDDVIAVIRGIGGSSDGFGKALTSPSPQGQAMAHRRALLDGEVEPASVGYIECHATGTQVGDVAEIRGLVEAYGKAVPSSIALGSAKTAVGHLRAAAGAVGLMRAALALRHRTIPPQPNVRQVNAVLELAGTPFMVPLAPQPFPSGGGPLRAAVTAVSLGGTNFHAVLEAASAGSPAATTRRAKPVAITGLSVHLHNASSFRELWEQGARSTPLVSGRAATALRYSEAPVISDRWQVAPSAIRSLDPAQLRALRAADEALRAAHYDGMAWDPAGVGIFVGYVPNPAQKIDATVRVHIVELAAELEAAAIARGVEPQRAANAASRFLAQVRAELAPLSEETLVAVLPNIIASRIAREFDFRGPQIVLETGTSSFLSALDAARQWLAAGEGDAAIVCGAASAIAPEHIEATVARATPDEVPYPRAEGVGACILRPWDDAAVSGELPVAKILGAAAATPVAIDEALTQAGVPAAMIGRVTITGAATTRHDEALRAEVARTYAPRGAPTPEVHSVSSSLGDCGAASSLAGLAEAAVALENRRLQAGGRLWEVEGGAARRAAVHAPKAHVVLEEPGVTSRRDVFGIALVDGETLAECVQRMLELLERCRRTDSSAYLATLEEAQFSAREIAAGHRLAIVAETHEELATRLQALVRVADPLRYQAALRLQGIFFSGPAERFKTVALFPGQGPQYPDMLRAAAKRFPSLAAGLALVDQEYEQIAGYALTERVYGGPPEQSQQRDEDIHTAVFAVNCLLYRFLVQQGFRPDLLLGQSAGELAALVAAGVLPFKDGLRAMRERTLSVLQLELSDTGKMVGVKCPSEQARELSRLVPGYAVVAADNGPGACIVSGGTEAMTAFVALCAQRGIDAQILPVSHAYHSEIIRPAGKRFGSIVNRLPLYRPRAPIISTVTGDVMPVMTSEGLAAHLTRQFCEPVRLRDALETAYAMGARLFVECGPKWGLSTLVNETLDPRPHDTQPLLHPKVGEVEQLQRGIASLWVRRLIHPFAHSLNVTQPPRESASEIRATMPEPQIHEARSAQPTRSARKLEPNVEVVLTLLVEQLANEVGYPEDMFQPDSNFEELGVDSIKRMRVVARLQEKLGIGKEMKVQIGQYPTPLSLATLFAPMVGNQRP